VREGAAEPAWSTAADFRHRMLDKSLYSRIYADGTEQNHLGLPGSYCFRLASHWRPADASYRLQARAFDTWGNRAQRELVMRVGAPARRQ